MQINGHDEGSHALDSTHSHNAPLPSLRLTTRAHLRRQYDGLARCYATEFHLNISNDRSLAS